MIYAGETVRVYADAFDWDDTPLTPSYVEGVLVVISYQGEEVEVGEMEWSTDESRWLYRWDSFDEAGAYTIEVIVTTEDGVSVDVKKLILTSPRSERRSAADEHFQRVPD